MLNPYKALQGIIAYFASARGVGHTNLMVRGLDVRSEAILVGATQEEAESIKTYFGMACRPVGLGALASGKLAGIRAPMAFDNHAIVSLAVLMVEDHSRALIALREAEPFLAELAAAGNEHAPATLKKVRAAIKRSES